PLHHSIHLPANHDFTCIPHDPRAFPPSCLLLVTFHGPLCPKSCFLGYSVIECTSRPALLSLDRSSAVRITLKNLAGTAVCAATALSLTLFLRDGATIRLAA